MRTYIALCFGYLGAGITLLPNPQFRAAMRPSDNNPPQNRPYDGSHIAGWTPAEIGTVQETLSISFLGTLIVLSVTRMLIVSHSSRLMGGLINVVLSFLGFLVFTYLFDLAAGIGYYHTLADSVMRLEFPFAVFYVVIAGAGTCLVTETLLSLYVPTVLVPADDSAHAEHAGTE